MESPQDIVKSYLDHHYRIVTWPTIGDAKGPRDVDWIEKALAGLYSYIEGHRVGTLTGTEIEKGKIISDVDIDAAELSIIAQTLLPPTGFVFGRKSKPVSHCFYTTPDPIPLVRYEDIDKTCLIELRGTKRDGTVGLQTMVPPSVWSKEGKREPLQFVRFETPAHIAEPGRLRQRVCLAAIGMLLAKHLGHNGFGHEVRLAWAGFLLRAGVEADDLVKMGEAMSSVCNNRELHDVRTVVESTAKALNSNQAKKVKGGPALIKVLGAKGRQIVTRINEWLGRDSDFVRDQNGRVLPRHQGNIRRAIEQLEHRLTYNEFADQLLMDDRPLEDPQWIPLCLSIEREFNFSPPVEYFQMVIKDMAWENSFHPVRDYINSLRWDGVPRLDTWLVVSAKADDSAYVRAISSIMLIAAVRRIRHPGCKYDEMVIWESPQGTEKSSAAQALCPNPSWFSDDLRLNLQSKELIEATLGKWIIEASELSGKRKAEIEQLKAMLSRQRDGPARMAYAHFPVERPRHFIIIGTTNSAVYLTDSTGARRFWPMTIKRFNVEWILAHRDQLWAEAATREAADESIRLDKSLWPHAAKEQEQRREIDPWEIKFRKHLLEDVAPSSSGLRRIATSQLWSVLGIPPAQQDRPGQTRISEVMQRLGFRRTRVRVGSGEPEVGYVQEFVDRLVEDGVVEEIDDDEPF